MINVKFKIGDLVRCRYDTRGLLGIVVSLSPIAISDDVSHENCFTISWFNRPLLLNYALKNKILNGCWMPPDDLILVSQN